MADFLLTPEPLNGEKCGEVVDMTNENENDLIHISNNNNIQSSPMDLTKTSVSSKPQNIHDITSPIEIHLGDMSSTSSTPSKRVLEEPSSTDLRSAEKRQKEQEESERLAWQLMEEESMNAYQMQVDYMRANPELFSEDDLAAVGAVLQESNNDQQAQQEGSEFDNEEEGDIEEDNSQEWTYEQLLELGQTIGDVKTERWKMRSSNIISSLPRLSFESYLTNKKGDEEEDSASCPVCMDTYENEQEVIVLPCHHFFHAECSEGWLKENNSCPLCKKKITCTP